MNRTYNIIWNYARNMYIVASEFSRGDSKTRSRVRAGGAIATFILSGIAGSALATDRTFEAVPGDNEISGEYSTTENVTAAVTANGSDVVVNDSGALTISTSGDSAMGLYVFNGAKVTLDDPNTTITTSGYGMARGLVNQQGTVTLANVTIKTTGDFGNAGIFNNGEMTGTGVTISTTGSESYGIQNYTQTFTLDSSKIDTYGEKSIGLSNFGRAALSDTQIATHGQNSDAISSSKATSAVVLNNGSVITTGENSRAVVINNGGEFDATGTTITSEQSAAIVLQNASNAAIANSNISGSNAVFSFSGGKNAATIDGGSITATASGGSAFAVDSGSADISVKNVQTMNADNLLTVANTADAVTLSAENSKLSGAVKASGDNVSMNLNENSQWLLTGDSSVGNLSSNGRITLGDENGSAGTLNVGNLILQDNSQTDVYLDANATSAPVIAQNATLNGTLNITGYGGASTLSADSTFTVIDAENAINGNFTHLTVAGMASGSVDFITFSGTVDPADVTNYVLTPSLAWYASQNPTPTAAHGTFTLNNADGSFTLSTALVDQNANATTGWDGKSLTKEGQGTLILNAANSYSGTTDVNQGTLWLGEAGVIGVQNSDQAVNVAAGATFGGDNGVVNGNVNSKGTVQFNDTLTINGDLSNAGSIISGNIEGTDGTTTGNTLIVNGDYTGNQGSLTLNTQLGDDTSPTDMLNITGNTSGNTTLYINNAGGQGALTQNGIEVIKVGGESNGTFVQGNQVQINAYEYRLYQDSGNWYLRSQATGEGGDVTPQYRADIGSYLSNQWLARDLQMQTLSDREGSQFKSQNGTTWARFKAGKNQSTAAGSNIDIDSNYSQFQMGGDVAAWNNGEQSLVVGVMGSYMNASSDSTGNRGADGSRFSADGKVDGYNLGVYATWFADARQHQGFYVDSWYQYGMYHNSVDNGDVGSTDYDSNASAVSLETGYRYDVALGDNTLSLTPQAQIVWQDYRADDIKDSSGTTIDGQNGDSWTTRLGLRIDSKMNKANDAVIQPFAEVNWLHTSEETAVNFGDTQIKQDIPADRAELKAGVQANVNKQWSVIAQVSGQKGDNDYSDVNGSLNVRYNW
ncbi:autotransporter outer membrane beta-barrel domain-containing protein [Enterobacter quasiroggenkampii]|uniref:autotransporter outer membrane beta-barrel domain-containing protein n=1 Tax=Enterobacter quasiroggenkampii TaxID=2497436 RepID=UPI000651015F|nr:autotransporter outer membrane beta-barrel domain-containing protein [Enterobacter quasiroggenkampii]